MHTDFNMNQSERKFTVVAIDGGAATGKSSTAKGVSEKLDFLHVDTGSHYRALTHAFLSLREKKGCQAPVEDLLKEIRTESVIVNRSAEIKVNGKVPSPTALRNAQVNQHVSHYAAIPAVRTFLLQFQRSHVQLAEKSGFKGLVMEGRDIGSVVLPDADFRFFLVADSHTRLKRRKMEGHADSIEDRDRADSSRITAPLLCPAHAIRIDTGPLTLQAVIEKLCTIILGTPFTESGGT